MTLARPTLDIFLLQLASLSSGQARELAELARVMDWRRDRDLANVLPVVDPDTLQVSLGATLYGRQDSQRTREALAEARRVAGGEAVDDATRAALDVLNRVGLSWPGMRLHKVLRPVALLALIAGAIFLVLRPADTDPAALAVFIALLAVVALSLLAGYLLPPSANDLREVVALAAAAHAAGPALEEHHFQQLAGGWYAVLEGRWTRGRRPYMAWGCLLVAIGLLVLLALALLAAGRQLWGPGAI